VSRAVSLCSSAVFGIDSITPLSTKKEGGGPARDDDLGPARGTASLRAPGGDQEHRGPLLGLRRERDLGGLIGSVAKWSCVPLVSESPTLAYLGDRVLDFCIRSPPVRMAL